MKSKITVLSNKREYQQIMKLLIITNLLKNWIFLCLQNLQIPSLLVANCNKSLSIFSLIFKVFNVRENLTVTADGRISQLKYNKISVKTGH